MYILLSFLYSFVSKPATWICHKFWEFFHTLKKDSRILVFTFWCLLQEKRKNVTMTKKSDPGLYIIKAWKRGGLISPFSLWELALPCLTEVTYFRTCSLFRQSHVRSSVRPYLFCAPSNAYICDNFFFSRSSIGHWSKTVAVTAFMK